MPSDRQSTLAAARRLGHLEPEPAAATLIVRDAYAASVRLHETPDRCEPEAEPGLRETRGSHVGIEDTVPHLHWNTDAGSISRKLYCVYTVVTM